MARMRHGDNKSYGWYDLNSYDAFFVMLKAYTHNGSAPFISEQRDQLELTLTEGSHVRII
jgi:hypothetical protein